MLLLILIVVSVPVWYSSFYIPLCFYLYLNFVISGSSSHIFTFHYASTYTEKDSRFQQRSKRFYIPLCFYLYSSSLSESKSNNFFYIPLCFYLYEICSECREGIYDFTFHYASTYTGAAKGRGKDFADFYIPLCFYLYTCQAQKLNPLVYFTFHYASTYTC